MRNTIKKALALLELTYKQKGFVIPEDPATMSMMLDTWTACLKDLSPKEVEVAVTGWMQTQPWPPTPADIRAMIVDTGVKTAAEAWEDVAKAIGKYGLFRGKKALASLDDTTRRIVEAIGWRNLCMSESIMTERAHFMRMYKELSNKKTELALMSPAVRDAISQIGGAIDDSKRLPE